MQPENGLFTQSSHAANRPIPFRRRSFGMQRLHSPMACLQQQHHAEIHSSAVFVRSVPKRNMTSHATVVAATEAPIKREAIDTQHTDVPTNSNGHRRRRQKQLALKNSDSRISQLESLRLLEWPELCQQVASFTSTAVAAELALAAKLPMASTQHQAEQLLQETAEAQQANLALKGIHDLRGLLEAVGRDRVLQPIYLDGVASSLEIAAAVAQRVQENQAGGQGARFPALQHLGRGIKLALPRLRQSIRHCVEGGRVLDRASARLGRVRRQRQDNMQSLRNSMNEWARNLASQNVSEEALVVMRRDRLCVPVKAGRQGQLPKGSVSLAVSASGSTIYMEPEPVVGLNNAEAMLRAQEQEEEESILAELSRMVKESTMSLQHIMKAVAALDIACARGKHAVWCGAQQPVFISQSEAEETGCMHALGVFHPLLLEPSLTPLKEPPATDAVNYDADAASLSSSAAADSMGKASWEPQQSPRQVYGKRGRPKGRAPCPVDLLVPAGVKVVAVTGPNTGGKTASLKTLGLTAIMAKAGLFIPTAHPAPVATPTATASDSSQPTLLQQQHRQPAESVQQQQQQQCPSEQQQQLQPHQQHESPIEQQQQQQQQAEQQADQQHQQPKLVFFDKVLADVGDSQSLQQSLSTFSGQIRRVRCILQEATPHSLILLDEVGSGTDPGEGAALAGALLDRLADSAALTYATTHHAQLKERPASDSRFINASVEFDLATLKPTYRLLWGEGGLSNALAVAEGLGFDPLVVQRARDIAKRRQEGGNPQAKAEELRQSLQQELLEAEEEAGTAAAEREAAEKALGEVQAEADQLALQQAAFKDSDAQLKSALQAAQSDLDWIISEVRAGKLSPEEAEECMQGVSESALTVKAATAAVNQAKSFLRDESAELRASGWSPKLNEAVRLIKLGGVPGKVRLAHTAQPPAFCPVAPMLSSFFLLQQALSACFCTLILLLCYLNVNAAVEHSIDNNATMTGAHEQQW
ncbi:hypothetical protein ABBQ32_002512 [Trebouxia sp. C0010 RCD-2024]